MTFEPPAFLVAINSASVWLDQVSERLPPILSRRGRARALTASETTQLSHIRDAIRLIAANVTDDPRAVAERLAHDSTTIDDAVSAINTAAKSLPTRLLHRVNGVITADRRAVSPLSAAIASFAVDAIPLLADDHASGRLRACLAPGCVLYFVQDYPRREWCSPACGNRARVARHYQRAQAARLASSTK